MWREGLLILKCMEYILTRILDRLYWEIRELNVRIVTTFYLHASVVCIHIRLSRIAAMSQGTS